jgi:hypothetical protein
MLICDIIIIIIIVYINVQVDKIYFRMLVFSSRTILIYKESD